MSGIDIRADCQIPYRGFRVLTLRYRGDPASTVSDTTGAVCAGGFLQEIANFDEAIRDFDPRRVWTVAEHLTLRLIITANYCREFRRRKQGITVRKPPLNVT
jgi:hypothetical protein